MMFRSDIFNIFFSFIIRSSIYAVFRFVSLRDIFILFLLMTWPEYLFLKPTSRSLPESIGYPLRDTYADQEGTGPLFVLGYRLVTEYFQFHPCHFSFYNVL